MHTELYQIKEVHKLHQCSLSDLFESDSGYNPDARVFNTMLAADDCGPGDSHGIQVAFMSVYLPAMNSGKSIETCWIQVPLLHIHDEPRHGTILHDFATILHRCTS
jgi:hypothetical protein